jgi:hypothetical protein
MSVGSRVTGRIGAPKRHFGWSSEFAAKVEANVVTEQHFPVMERIGGPVGSLKVFVWVKDHGTVRVALCGLSFKPLVKLSERHCAARPQPSGGAGSGTGGCGQVPCTTHCTTTKEFIPDVPCCMACQYEPSG